MSNPVVKWQIIARDPKKSASFYTTLFNWRADTDNALGYRQITTGGPGGIDGGMWPSQGEGPDMVQLFVEVEDVDATVAAATQLGARVLVPTTALPDGDVMAVLLDPAGLSFGLVRRKST